MAFRASGKTLSNLVPSVRLAVQSGSHISTSEAGNPVMGINPSGGKALAWLEGEAVLSKLNVQSVV